VILWEVLVPREAAEPPEDPAATDDPATWTADQAVAALSDELLAKNAAAGSPLNVLRAEHRREHLNEIEHALAR